MMAIEHNVDIVTVTGHWMSEMDLKTYQLQGYRLSCFWREVGSHGGSAILCGKDVDVTEICDIRTQSISGVFEYCAVLVSFQSMELLIITI